MFAICRGKSMSDQSEITAASMHATRTRETPNADPSKRHLNRVVFGAADPAAELERRLKILEKEGVKFRANGNKVIELFLGASPDFFEAFPEKKEAFYEQSVDWLGEYFGRGNLLSVIAHEDESTPHLSVFVIPVDETPRKRGPRKRLNAARWMDGPVKLSKMQTSYAKALAPLGLQRGLEGSKATHRDVKKWYGIIARAKAITGLEDGLQALEAVAKLAADKDSITREIGNKTTELQMLMESLATVKKGIVKVTGEVNEARNGLSALEKLSNDERMKANKKKKEYEDNIKKLKAEAEQAKNQFDGQFKQIKDEMNKVHDQYKKEIMDNHILEGEKHYGKIGGCIDMYGKKVGLLHTKTGTKYFTGSDVLDKLKGQDYMVGIQNGRYVFDKITTKEVIQSEPVKKVEGPKLGGGGGMRMGLSLIHISEPTRPY